MSNLSSLLNPKPEQKESTGASGASSSPSHHDSHGPQTYPGMQPLRYGAAPPCVADDAAQTLDALSTGNTQPPGTWPARTESAATNVQMLSIPRRPSFHGDDASPIELPQPSQVARKMSSPTLDQYHVTSTSPEQQRSLSRPPEPDSRLALAPINPVPDQSPRPTEVRDIPLVVHHPHKQKELAKDKDIPSSFTLPQSAMPSLDLPRPAADAAAASSQICADRAHSPVASLRHEHSARTQSPLRESSVPVPSTEMPAPATTINPRKRPPPKSAAKKGTASAVRKESTTKKRKVDSTATSSSKSKGALAGAKKLASTSATPSNSSPAPRSARSASTPPRSVGSAEGDEDVRYSEDEEEEEEQGTPGPDADLYCLCRRPDTGTFMIGCDGGCDDWFHGKCVNIAERDKGLIDRYVCPACTENGLGPTTWKRMCRRVGCRLPARTPGAASKAAKKGGKAPSPSKYCSDSCAVLYFKEMIAKTRGAPGSSSKTKNTANSPDDLGPRGGALSAAELKAMIDAASDIDDFKRMGGGVLSPPDTPPSTTQNDTSSPAPLYEFTEAEQERVSKIVTQKDAARARHSVLKDRLKFITMLKQTATTLAEDRNLKPKEFCGFDTRMLWTDDEFDAWRNSTPDAKEGLRTGIMPASMAAHDSADADGDTNMANGDDQGSTSSAGICTKKRCARHHDWAKLALDDVRFEMSENSETMRGLDREEKEILQRAGLRARIVKAGGAGGAVEIHDEGNDDEVAVAVKTETEDPKSILAAAAADIAPMTVTALGDQAPSLEPGFFEKDEKKETAPEQEKGQEQIALPSDESVSAMVVDTEPTIKEPEIVGADVQNRSIADAATPTAEETTSAPAA